MARKKSYFAKSNRGRAASVLAHNVMASHKNKQQQKKKAAAAAERRQAAEAEKQRKRLAREAEKARNEAEKQAERRRREQEKLDAKASAVAERLKLDFDKVGLYPGDGVINRMAHAAVKASVSPAKARSYFIDGKEEEVARECAAEFLNSQGISDEHSDVQGYEELVDFVAPFRPQKNAVEDPKYQKIKGQVEEAIQRSIEAEERRDERKEFVEELLSSKSMFKDDIEDLAEIIESKDMGRQDILDSADYQSRIESKQKYVDEIKAQIVPFSLNQGAG